MAELQAYSCESISGAVLDRIPTSAWSYNRLLSAGGDGSITIPLDGTFTRAQLDNLTMEWARLIVLERNGVVEFIGYPLGEKYVRGQGHITLELQDVWKLLDRRGGWNHSAPNVEDWSITLEASLAAIGAGVINRARLGPELPAMGYPVTLDGNYPGPTVTRSLYGYNVETAGDIFSDLMAEGLDVYFKPRWHGGGQADWLYRSGPAWSSGVTHEFFVTAEASTVVGFSASSDALRVTNNARYLGEGSEQDMLVRSERNMASPYPLLDRATSAKHVNNPAQLSAMAANDLVMYSGPTRQWDFTIDADIPVDVGDAVRLHFDGDPWIADGWHQRRVVKVSARVPGPDVKTIGVQPTGGA
ncbi:MULTISPECIES: hypothetical protein [unclassified Microbacterium]|uniref:hypothetical protein n=1 Tax=unclassified Microbacterium TaxID=2609290 RepID=UPI000ECB9CFB|nr:MULTISPECIES: hypothetical protein [unclassified Microbacterium]MBT2485818.1 hypothetical protein [Microbacterium sp. ISL-108]RKN68581.1 hypothetical protein D7252_13970 [Microbacterium sp. CGR2]